MNMRTFILLILCVALIVRSLAVRAQNEDTQTTYDYTGTTMSGTTYGDPEPYSPPQSGSLVLDGTMVLSAPLAPNLVNAPVDPLSASFSVNGNLASYGGALNIDTMDFTTNSSGQITGWTVVLSTNTYINGWGVFSTAAGDIGQLNYVPLNGGDGAITSASSTIGGSWVDPPSFTTAPEIDPSSAISGMSLLLGMLAVLRGRRAKLF